MHPPSEMQEGELNVCQLCFGSSVVSLSQALGYFCLNDSDLYVVPEELTTF
jgi:hypothetical protein